MSRRFVLVVVAASLVVLAPILFVEPPPVVAAAPEAPPPAIVPSYSLRPSTCGVNSDGESVVVLTGSWGNPADRPIGAVLRFTLYSSDGSIVYRGSHILPAITPGSSAGIVIQRTVGAVPCGQITSQITSALEWS